MNLQKERHEAGGDVQKKILGKGGADGFTSWGKERFTSQKRGYLVTFKKNKKIIDDSMAIFSLTETSADASRYFVR